jgi:hypothetical protein
MRNVVHDWQEYDYIKHMGEEIFEDGLWTTKLEIGSDVQD